MKKDKSNTFMRRFFPAIFVIGRGIRLLFDEKSYYVEIGYVRSIRRRQPMTRDGAPLPWMNYGIIDLLNDRLHRGLHLFEYGSGNSTWYYAGKAASVTSIEHNRSWYEHVNSSKRDNVTIKYVDIDNLDAYTQAIQNQGKQFDVVIVDGRERVKCLQASAAGISEQGVIILDDSNRDHYRDGVEWMLSRGFRKLDFKGLKPGGIRAHQSSIFYRDNNCFNL